jgi:hypothetical protein
MGNKSESHARILQLSMIIRIQGPCGIKRCEVRALWRWHVAGFKLWNELCIARMMCLQVEPKQSLSDLLPLYVTQLSDGAQSVNIFRDAAMTAPVAAGSFEELGCKHGDM